MYLKSIKAYGFKSFADKTEINFEKNINGIVGPNGSGKSNVVDAVRWVLGEQSIKSLRGDNSEDVIFAGSKSRKPLNSASVTLIFDNSDMYIPIEYSEVSIKRVVYRTGENEYYLNNERCRLKDITNILSDTGADRESFNIISQGKIDEILSTKPTDRRVVFESAAGTIKYKRRKEEAIRKLDRTHVNMQRVNDILTELESNLLPLEKQSKNAKIFLEYKEELTDLELSLMVHDIYNYNYQTEKLKASIESLKDELMKLSNTHTTNDVDLLEKKDSVKQIELELANEQNTLLEVTKSIEKIDADIRLLKERKKYTEDKEADSASRVIKLKEDLLKLQSKHLEVENNIQKVLEEKKLKEATYASIMKKYQGLFNQKNKNNESISINNRKLTDLKYKIEYLENSIESRNSLPMSVKNIINNPRFSNAHDVIGNLIEMDKKYYQAISTALGGACNYLVVDTSKDAREMVDYLKENKLGRATFFPIDSIKMRVIDSSLLEQVKSVSGYIGVASDLVTYKDIYKNIILNQLGNVIVSDNLASAHEISKILMRRYKVVTLDGQVVNVGGSITGGSFIQNHNPLKEQYELDTNRQKYADLQEEVNELENSIASLDKEVSSYLKQIQTIKNDIQGFDNELKQDSIRKEEISKEMEGVKREVEDLESILSNQTDMELDRMLTLYYSAMDEKNNILSTIEKATSRKEHLDREILELEHLIKQDRTYETIREKELKEKEIKLNTINVKLDQLLISLGEEYNITYESAREKYKLEIEESLARDRLKEIKTKIKDLGYVNVEAVDEYNQKKERYDFLIKQRDDLTHAEDTLLEIIDEMDAVIKDRFLKTFEAIRKEFKKVFVSIFKGGEAELVLTDEDNILETGIEIQAVPSGKTLKSISLLSGGERTLTAISLLFAILNVRPVPFCLLDEVEAALDDANVDSFGNYLYQYRNKTQFILITHKKKTMEFADVLYGITMQESGVSKLVSVRLEEIENK